MGVEVKPSVCEAENLTDVEVKKGRCSPSQMKRWENNEWYLTPGRKTQPTTR